LAFGFARTHIAADLGCRQRRKTHRGHRHGLPDPVRADAGSPHRDGGQHAVAPPRQLGEHPAGIGCVSGFSQNAPPQGDGRVRTQHRCQRQAQPPQTHQRRLQLELGDPTHIRGRRLPRLDGFQRLHILVRFWQQGFAAHPPLLQQLAPARTLGSEIDEGAHGVRWEKLNVPLTHSRW
ncbi:hypothetical protein RZS08_10435, partial [Arthrospira platensis SPKY1]|nr:hypothetical protein [Arthrospira platensis SPKY1]